MEQSSQLVKKFPALNETRSSLPFLQQPATYPYPESDQSSPSPHISHPEDSSFACMSTEENRRFLMGHIECNFIPGCGFSGHGAV
jgi:hypothetical protein